MSGCERKKILNIIGAVAAAVFVLGGTLFFFCLDVMRFSLEEDELPVSSPLDTVLTREQATEDLDYFYRVLSTRHLAWIDGRSELPQRVEARYKELRAGVREGMTVLDLYRGVCELSAMLGDIHTDAFWYGYQTLLDNRRAYQEAAMRYGTVIQVDGVPFETLVERYRRYKPVETGDYAAYMMRETGLTSESVLRMCGIDTADGVDYTFDTEEGIYTLHSDFYQPEPKSITVYVNSIFSFMYDAYYSMAYLSISECVYDDDYIEDIEEFFDTVKANKYKNIVVDLRGNRGGDARCAYEFISRLGGGGCRLPDMDYRYGWFIYKERNRTLDRAGDDGFKGNLYVLTDYGTASAAMIFAMTIKDNALGTVIGQPSCNLPDMYTAKGYYSMPNTHLAFCVSVGKLYRIDSSVQEGLPFTPDMITEPGEEMRKVYELFAPSGGIIIPKNR